VPEFKYTIRIETPNEPPQIFDIARPLLTIGGTDAADLSLADPNVPPKALELTYEGGLLMARRLTNAIVPLYGDSPRVGVFIVEPSRPVVLGRHTIRWFQSAESVAVGANPHLVSSAQHSFHTPPSDPQLTDEEIRKALSASSTVPIILALTIGSGILAGVFFAFRDNPSSPTSSTPTCSQACRDPRISGNEFARGFANTAGRAAFAECIGRSGDSDACEQEARDACTRACARATGR